MVAVARPPYSGTAHQVTLNAFESPDVKTLPPAEGFKSAKNGAIRGGPVNSLDTDRSVLAVSPSPNVRFPSEFTNM